jgi:LysM repeat protein
MPAPTPIPCGWYVVQPGDTLSEIADSSGIPVQTIRRDNNLRDEDVIATGQRLYIRGQYTVQKGDTIGEIAIRTNVPLETILRDNSMKEHDPIYPGQRLMIRCK